jgi:3-phenylpropionate/cinnamic acid dioxygenase small subunit
MSLSTSDRIAINDLIALHGHLMDAGDFDGLGELFTNDVSYDLEDYGLGYLQGIDAIIGAAVALGDDNPLGHHVTNIVIVSDDGDVVRVRSKGIGVQSDGSTGSVVYEDTVVREPEGWRIGYRKVVARRRPLHP